MKTILVSLLFFLLFIIKAQAQTATPNIGFEDGTFNHWECWVGSVDTLGKPTVFLAYPQLDKHKIVGPDSVGFLDSHGQFPVLCPNGSKYSIKLGNEEKGPHAERVTYTLTVPQVTAYSIVFNYAVVLVTPGHLPYQQPKFTVKVYDVTDNKYLDCPSFDFAASPNLPGFKQVSITDSVFYKDWSSATINLTRYVGKTVRLEFTTNACVFGAHFGYAYLDVNENVGSPLTGNAYCVGQRSVTLHAPFGFAGYKWYNDGFKQQVGEGQNFNISPPPPDGTKYAVIVTPYLGVGCADTLYTLVNKIDEGFKLAVQDTVTSCLGGKVNLTDAAITAGSSPGMTLSYFTDSLAVNYLPQPDSVTTAGTYYVRGINADGCMNILPIQAIFADPELTITAPNPVDFPGTVDLSKTFTSQTGINYSYYKDAAATEPLPKYTAVNQSGTYYIKASNSMGCNTIKPVKVVIIPPTPVSVKAPNTFTPNNDGINDHFTLNIVGSGTFGSMKIFNRYGKQVFTTTSPMDYWDGKYNGRNLPTGTYYWVFEGIDEYYQKKLIRSGSITLIR